MRKKFKYFFVIDKEDYDLTINASTSWHSINNYVGFNKTSEYTGKRKPVYLHDLIMRNQMEAFDIEITADHINRNPMDNRRTNLRIATKTEQNHNQGRT